MKLVMKTFGVALATSWLLGCTCTKQPEQATTQTGAQTGAQTETQNPQGQAMPNEIKELRWDTVAEGDGKAAANGMKVTVHYTGTLVNGTKFDSSLDRGSPFSFTLGAGQVIPGWDQGLLGMKVQGKRKLYIPAHLAYGERGVGDVIPPNSPLIFEVELLSVE